MMKNKKKREEEGIYEGILDRAGEVVWGRGEKQFVVASVGYRWRWYLSRSARLVLVFQPSRVVRVSLFRQHLQQDTSFRRCLLAHCFPVPPPTLPPAYGGNDPPLFNPPKPIVDVTAFQLFVTVIDNTFFLKKRTIVYEWFINNIRFLKCVIFVS